MEVDDESVKDWAKRTALCVLQIVLGDFNGQLGNEDDMQSTVIEHSLQVVANMTSDHHPVRAEERWRIEANHPFQAQIDSSLRRSDCYMFHPIMEMIDPSTEKHCGEGKTDGYSKGLKEGQI